tara:strand:+ start:409 stop:627 length:219 start_codon:yes stop_codon:yes gene_type:complete
MLFEIVVSNYNNKQITEYTETSKDKGTMGLIAAQKNALKKFREEWPENEDEERFLKVKSKLTYQGKKIVKAK